MTQPHPPAVCPVRVRTQSASEAVAVQSGERTITFAELDRTIGAVEGALRGLGISEEARVASLMPDDWRSAVLLFALARLGAVFVPLNRREPRANILEQLEVADADWCIVEQEELDGRVACLPWREVALRQGESGAEKAPPAVDPSRPLTILFTSGSAGRRVGVVHSLSAHWYSADGSNLNIPVDSSTRWLVSLPLYHAGGLSILFRCVFGGGCAILPESKDLEAAIVRHEPTHISLVPTQLQRLLDAEPRPPLAGLTHVLVGGAFIPDRLVARAVEAGVPIHKSYGTTETASQIATTPSQPERLDLASSGRVLRHREVRVEADGSILVRGPVLFDRLIGAGSDQPLTDGWYRTGDIGRVDGSGRLTVFGRVDQMFVSGGENVHPEEIERAILNTGLVERAVVVAVPSDEFGYRPVAFLEPMSDVAALRSRLRESLAGFKIPDRFLELPPSTARLKPDRSMLAMLARERL